MLGIDDLDWSLHYCGSEEKGIKWTVHQTLTACALWQIGAYVPLILTLTVFVLAFGKLSRLYIRLKATCETLHQHSVLALALPKPSKREREGVHELEANNYEDPLVPPNTPPLQRDSKCPYFPQLDETLPVDPYPGLLSWAQLGRGIPAVVLAIIYALLPIGFFLTELFEAIDEAREQANQPNPLVARVPLARFIYVLAHFISWTVFAILLARRIRTALPAAFAHNWHFYIGILTQIVINSLWIHSNVMRRTEGEPGKDSKIAELEGAASTHDLVLVCLLLATSVFCAVFFVLAVNRGWTWFHDVVRTYLILSLSRVGKAFAQYGDTFGSSGIVEKDAKVTDQESFITWYRRARIREATKWLLGRQRYLCLSKWYASLLASSTDPETTTTAAMFPTCLASPAILTAANSSLLSMTSPMHSPSVQTSVLLTPSVLAESASSLVNLSHQLAHSIYNESNGLGSSSQSLLSPRSPRSPSRTKAGESAGSLGAAGHSSARGESCALCGDVVARTWIQVKKGVLYDDVDGGYSYFDYDDEIDIDDWGVQPVGSSNALSMLRRTRLRGRRRANPYPVYNFQERPFDAQGEALRISQELARLPDTQSKLSSFDFELSNMGTHFVDLWRSLTGPMIDELPTAMSNTVTSDPTKASVGNTTEQSSGSAANADISDAVKADDILTRVEDVRRLRDLSIWKSLGAQSTANAIKAPLSPSLVANSASLGSSTLSLQGVPNSRASDTSASPNTRTKEERDIENAEKAIEDMDPLWESQAGHFSTLYFTWIHPLIRLGYLRPLQAQDVDDIPPMASLRRVLGQFDHAAAVSSPSPSKPPAESSRCSNWFACCRSSRRHRATSTQGFQALPPPPVLAGQIQSPAVLDPTNGSPDVTWTAPQDIVDENDIETPRGTPDPVSGNSRSYTRLSRCIQTTSYLAMQKMRLIESTAAEADAAYASIIQIVLKDTIENNPAQSEPSSSASAPNLAPHAPITGPVPVLNGPNGIELEVQDSVEIDRLLGSIQHAINQERAIQDRIAGLACGSSIPSDEWDPSEDAYKSAYVKHIFKGLWAVTGRRVILSCVNKLLGDMTSFAGPALLAIIVKYADNVDKGVPSWAKFAGPKFYGLILALILAFSAVAQAIFLQHSYHLTIREAMRARTLMIGLVYRKALRLSLAARNRVSIGRIQNLMNSDASRVENVYWMGYYIIFAPIQCAIAIVLLYNLLGWSTLIGVAVLVIALPTQLGMGKYLGVLSKARLKFTDRRATLVMELLAAIRTLKLLGWDRAFSKLIQMTRMSEVLILRKQQLFSALQSFVVQCVPTLVAVLTFVTFATTGDNVLTPAKAFAALSLFALVQIPLWSLPVTVQYIVEARISLIRIGEFLAEPERDAPGLLIDWMDMIPSSNPSEAGSGSTTATSTTVASPKPHPISELAPSTTPSAQLMRSRSPGLALLPLLVLNPGDVVITRRDFWAVPYHSRRRPLATLITNMNADAQGTLMRIPGAGTYGFVWDTWHLGAIYRQHVRSFHSGHLHLDPIRESVSRSRDKSTTSSPVLAVVMSRETEAGAEGSSESDKKKDEKDGKKTKNDGAGQIAAAPITVRISVKTPAIGQNVSVHDSSVSPSNGNGQGDSVSVTLDALLPIPTMHVPKLAIKPGSLVVIVGPVGSGKSFLLQAIMGELYHSPSLFGRLAPFSSTERSINPLQKSHPLSAASPAPLRSSAAFTSPVSSIAYVPQTAWIVNATLRDNILMGAPFIESVYEETVTACELRPDFAQFPQGDLTEIGERGANLSGGQKQRVNLARAVYRRHVCGVYLLDAPLAALDANVAKSVFDNVLGREGLLRNHTRILVTHHLELAKHADTVILMQSNVQGGITPEDIAKAIPAPVPRAKSVVTRMAHTMSPLVRGRGLSMSRDNSPLPATPRSLALHSQNLRGPITPLANNVPGLGSADTLKAGALRATPLASPSVMTMDSDDHPGPGSFVLGSTPNQALRREPARSPVPDPNERVPVDDEPRSILKVMQSGPLGPSEAESHPHVQRDSQTSGIVHLVPRREPSPISPTTPTRDNGSALHAALIESRFQTAGQVATAPDVSDEDDMHDYGTDLESYVDESDNHSVAASLPRGETSLVPNLKVMIPRAPTGLFHSTAFQFGADALQPHSPAFGSMSTTITKSRNRRYSLQGRSLTFQHPKGGNVVSNSPEHETDHVVTSTATNTKRPSLFVRSQHRPQQTRRMMNDEVKETDPEIVARQVSPTIHSPTGSIGSRHPDTASTAIDLSELDANAAEEFTLSLKLPLAIRIAQIGTYDELMNKPLADTLAFDPRYLFLSGTAGLSASEIYGAECSRLPKLAKRQKELLSLWIDRDSGEVISGISKLSEPGMDDGSQSNGHSYDSGHESSKEEDVSETDDDDWDDQSSETIENSDCPDKDQTAATTATTPLSRVNLRLNISSRDTKTRIRRRWIGHLDPLETTFHALFPPLIPFSVMVTYQDATQEDRKQQAEKKQSHVEAVESKDAASQQAGAVGTQEKREESFIVGSAGSVRSTDNEDSIKSPRSDSVLSQEKKQATSNKPREQAKPATGLVQRETKIEGALSWKVYFMYLQAMSGPLAIASIILLLGQAALSRLTDFWLSKWSNDDGRHDSMYFVKSYTYLSFGSIGLNLLANLVGALAGVRAARVMHDRMLSSISLAPLSFFDTTPLGRILNRFSADTDAIDQKLPNGWAGWLSQTVQVASLLLVILLSNFWFVVGLVPVLLLFFWLSQYYRNTSRELRRLENVARSPLFSHFEATLDGLTSVRALGAERGFLAACCSLIDSHSAIWYANQCSNRWLALRLDTLGAVVLLSTSCAMIIGSTLTTDETGRRHLNSGLIGLTLSYALSVTSKLNWTVRNSIDVETQLSSVERVEEYSSLEPEGGCNPSQLHDPVYVEALQMRPSILASRLTTKVPESAKPPPPPPALARLLNYVDSSGLPLIASSDQPAVWPSRGLVTIKSVYMRYRPGEPLVVRGITVKIAPGEKVAVVGRTGAGKSSLIQMLFRAAEHEGTRALEARVKYKYLLDEEEKRKAFSKYIQTASDAGLDSVRVEPRSRRTHSHRGITNDDSLTHPLLEPGLLAKQTGAMSVGNSSNSSDVLDLTTEESIAVAAEVGRGPPVHGKILIDGLDIAKIPLAMLRRALSVIPQDPILFSGSIRFNLDPEREIFRQEHEQQQLADGASQVDDDAGKPILSPTEQGRTIDMLKADDKDGDLWAALESVGLASQISALPGGLDYRLASGDDLFSQGQRQLLCVARAVVRKSQILVLDEATASVDAHTDAWVQKMIRTQFAKCTVITIAHRLDTVIDYDKVIVMDRGRVAEQGNPLQLTQNPQSLFSALWRAHQHQNE